MGGAIVGCTPMVAQRGNAIDADRVAQIVAGQTTREIVAQKLGTPTLVSPFDDREWYYVGRRTEQESFLDPTVATQEGYRIRFDDAGVVNLVEPLAPDAFDDNLQTADRTTPTYGRDLSLVQELFGGLQRFGRKPEQK